MAYTNGQATPRADIYALVQQANSDFNKLFIADQVLPVKPEDARRGIYMKANLAAAELLNADAQPREQGNGYARINRAFSTDTYDTQEYGLESIVDDSYEAEVNRFMNLEATEAMLLERQLKISYEQRVATLLLATGSWSATAITPVAAYTTAAVATTDPASDVDTAKTTLLKQGCIANAVVMSQNVFNRLRRAQLMQNQIYGVVPRGANQRALPSEQDIAQALGVETLYVGKAPKNTAAKGQTFAGGFIWSDSYIWVGNVQGGEYTAGGAGRTIQWRKDTTGLFTPETYRSDERRSNIMRVRQNVAEKIIDNTAGVLITTSYA